MSEGQEPVRKRIDPSEVGSIEEVRQSFSSTSRSVSGNIQSSSNGTIDQSQASTEVAPVRWKNRRRMAWISLLGIIGITVICLFFIDKDKLLAMDDILIWYYITLGGVILGYMGFTTLPQLPIGRK